MGYYNRRDAAAEYERTQVRAEAATFGHDPEAALRAGRVAAAQRTVAEVGNDWPSDLKDLLRQAAEKEIAAIRASGPVGCACGYWRCSESQPHVEQPAPDDLPAPALTQEK